MFGKFNEAAHSRLVSIVFIGSNFDACVTECMHSLTETRHWAEMTNEQRTKERKYTIDVASVALFPVITKSKWVSQFESCKQEGFSLKDRETCGPSSVLGWDSCRIIYVFDQFRHNPLPWQITVIPHTKKANVSYRMHFEVMESFGLILCDVH